MKTIQKANDIQRVDNDTADSKVRLGWSFVPKSKWKTWVRDVNKKEPEKKPEKIISKKS